MDLLETPLHAWHAAHRGRMVDFAGWSMPLLYDSIVDEHHATRRAMGLFDISHMGRLDLYGPKAGPFLDRLVTRRVTNLAVGRIRYALMCNPEGGVLDDILVYRLADSTASDEATFRIVVNASNRPKILAWLAEQGDGGPPRVDDITERTAMIAAQGPRAMELVAPQLNVDAAALKYYSGCEAICGGADCYVSRTGYTGEDGLELILAADTALDVWQALVAGGVQHGGQTAGLGCRDTLRLEAGMPLYGHELSEEITPLSAGLASAVDFAERDFVGRAALVHQRETALPSIRVGLQLSGRRVPRAGSVVLNSQDEVGRVTSGTFSPTLERPIAMALIDPAAAELGRVLQVDIRGQQHDAHVVQLPFYRRDERGDAHASTAKL